MPSSSRQNNHAPLEEKPVSLHTDETVRITLQLISVCVYSLQHCGASEPSSPLILMERLSFEMHKTYTETRLQLHLSPATIVLADRNEVNFRPSTNCNCKKNVFFVY